MYTVVLMLVLGGCTYDEQIPETELKGHLVLSKDAVTRQVKATDDPNDATTVAVTDIRLAGPIYIGAYAGIDSSSLPYPIPAQGPIISQEEGDAFPYGGTTVGRFDFACYKFLSCKVTTGRFVDYADMLDYFTNVLHNPIKDDQGTILLSESEFQQQCFDYYYATTDNEMSFIGPEAFTETDAGFEADFTLFHTIFVPGMSVWGFMDAPFVSPTAAEQSGTFGTCDTTAGRQASRYDQTFYEGASYTNILNRPNSYLDIDDYVSAGVTVENADDTIQLTIDLPVLSE